MGWYAAEGLSNAVAQKLTFVYAICTPKCRTLSFNWHKLLYCHRLISANTNFRFLHFRFIAWNCIYILLLNIKCGPILINALNDTAIVLHWVQCLRWRGHVYLCFFSTLPAMNYAILHLYLQMNTPKDLWKSGILVLNGLEESSGDRDPRKLITFKRNCILLGC